jgi:hypothetical protein
MTLTLEELLKLSDEEWVDKQFEVTVIKTFDRGVSFSIHPKNSDADDHTKEFMVSDNILTDLSK